MPTQENDDVQKGPMNRRRAHRRISHSQRRDAPTVGEQRQRNQEQQLSPNKPCVRKTWGEQNEVREQQEKETLPRGACPTMCPAKELKLRETQNRLHRFEMLAGTKKDRRPRGDPSRAVKEYSRPAAGKDATNPTDLRPPAVLLKTVHYLIDDIAASTSLHPWTEVYIFVFDRLRGVKQDMIIQRVSGSDCVSILERMVRFLIYASYYLCGEPLHLYDPRINDTHLQENLSWLLECYAAETEQYPKQEEFEALGLLYNLGSSCSMHHIMDLSRQLRSSPAVSLALSINRAFLERNPVRLLRLAQKLDFLQCCALHRHLVTSRKDLFQILSHGFSSRNCRFPLDRLAQLLFLDKSLTAQLCSSYGAEVTQDDQVIFSKTAFTEAEQGKLQCKLYHNMVAEKQRDLTVRSIIDGCA